MVGYKGALVSVDVEMIENLNALETVVICCMFEKTETISGLSDSGSRLTDSDHDTLISGDGFRDLEI